MDVFYPVQLLADWLTYDVFLIVRGSHPGDSVNFFIYDTIKIFILLAVIIFIVSIVRTYLPPEKTRKFLVRKHQWTGNVLASLVGVITPFCTCSAIPLFIGFIEAGVPLGVTFSFLVASPMINEIALVLLIGMFGWRIALIYILSGLVIAVVSGIIVGRLKMEKYVADFVFKVKAGEGKELPKMTGNRRFRYAAKYTRDIIKKVAPYVVLGIALGALIHGYVPVDFLARYAGEDKWYAVPLAILVGIPLYSNAAGIIPLVSVLTEKGMAIGTTLAFMMAVTGLSLPEFLILKKVMKTRLILIFAGIVGTGIIFTGYFFNFILS